MRARAESLSKSATFLSSALTDATYYLQPRLSLYRKVDELLAQNNPQAKTQSQKDGDKKSSSPDRLSCRTAPFCKPATIYLNSTYFQPHWLRSMPWEPGQPFQRRSETTCRAPSPRRMRQPTTSATGCRSTSRATRSRTPPRSCPSTRTQRRSSSTGAAAVPPSASSR